MAMKLRQDDAALPRRSVPAYDRATLTPGIVHIGLGNFHRAHMAVYLDDLFDAGRRAGLGDPRRRGRAPVTRGCASALAAQDCLSTVIELDPEGLTRAASSGR